MNDYEHRCFWEEDKIPTYYVVFTEEQVEDIRLNFLSESPYGKQYNFIKIKK